MAEHTVGADLPKVQFAATDATEKVFDLWGGCHRLRLRCSLLSSYSTAVVTLCSLELDLRDITFSCCVPTLKFILRYYYFEKNMCYFQVGKIFHNKHLLLLQKKTDVQAGGP